MVSEGVSTLLEREIVVQGDVLEQVLQRRREVVAQVARRCLDQVVFDWVVTGCGDSLFAGMLAETWFAEAAGVPLRAIHALEFSRYLYRGVGEHSVVFALSYSGNTARVVEAATAAKSRGAFVVAITANEHSRLVDIADEWLQNDALEERSNCRTQSFVAASMLLRMVADAVAGDRGLAALSGAEDLPGVMNEYTRRVAEPVRAIVEALPDDLSYTVIGGGYGYAVSQYGAAKLYEAATIPAHVAELEQFVHCEIFPVSERSCVIITAPQGPSMSRALEVAEGLQRLHATTIAITDSADLAALCTHAVMLPEGLPESLTPFPACVPHQYLALYLGVRRGDTVDLVGNKWVNRPLIERSIQWGPDEYRDANSGDGQ